MGDSKDSYVTPELMSELNDILEEEAEEKALFDDFSDELAELAPVTITCDKNAERKASTDREDYLKERRKHPNATLPDSVEA